MTITDPRTADRAAYLAEVELSRRLQIFGAWCGPIFTLLLFGGWGILAGFIPLISGDDSAADVASSWRDHQELTLFGLSLAMVGSFLVLVFYLTISTQMRRLEIRSNFLSTLQFAGGVIIVIVLAIPLMVFIVGAFRPERSDELDQLINDASYIMLILPWPPIVLQVGAIAVIVWGDRRENPIFPRWVGYFNAWVGVFLIPANLIIFFKDGPFAWTGLIGFWLPAAVFGLWYWIMFVVLLKAIAQGAEEDRAQAENYPVTR